MSIRSFLLLAFSFSPFAIALIQRSVRVQSLPVANLCLRALSSSEIKDDKPRPPKKSVRKASVVTRLHRAATKAHKEKKLREKAERKVKRTQGRQRKGSKKVPTLRQLNIEIDRRLNEKRREADILSPMINVVNHNQEVNDYHDRSQTTKKCNNVAIVLGKPLHHDEITVEYANRVRTLVSALLYEGYKPDAVCFVGPRSAGNLVTDADAG